MGEFLPGDILGGRYEIIEQVGIGGMAEVYKAKCLKLNRFVAIKVLKPEFRNDPEFVESFNIESQATASLSHKNIVSVYDIGKEKGDISYIVMEYVDGITLKQYIDQNQPLPWQEAVDFASQICSALEHAHSHHVIHKDIKPHNIMVTEDKVLKVMDFGIAQAASSSTVKLSETTMGSVHYLSPEQARGGYVDEKSDIYSLGVVLYEMLTGKVPFDASTPVSVALMHVENTAVPVTELNPDIPAMVGHIVEKAMSKEQAKRYQSASEMLADLNSAVQIGEGIAAKEPSFIDYDSSPTVRMAPVTPTKKDMGDNMSARPMTRKEKKQAKKKNKKPLTKADKVAIVAALLTAVLVIWAVYAMAWPAISQIFDGSSASEKTVSVPSITGLDKLKAKLKVEESDLVFEVKEEKYSDSVDKDKVISQDPAAGDKVKKGSTIKVVISKGKTSDTMPDVLNTDRSDAVKQLKEMGFDVEVIEENDSDYPNNVVIRQVPKEGEKMKEGDKVKLYVNVTDDNSSSTEEDSKVSVPSLVGLTQDQAEQRLADHSLSLGTVRRYYSDTVEKGKVIKQTVSSGTKVDKNSSVGISVSIGPKETSSSTPSTSSPSSNNNSSSHTEDVYVTKSVTVNVPQDKDSTLLTVKVDGDTVYNKTLSKEEGSIVINVKGKKGDTKKVSVYYDGELKTSVDKSF